MSRTEAPRCFSAGAARRAEAPDVVPGVFCSIRARVLPEESRGAEGAAVTKHGGETCRQQAPNDRIPSSPSLRRLRRDGHRGPAVRSPRGQGTRCLQHARRQLDLVRDPERDGKVPNSMRKLPSSRDRTAIHDPDQRPETPDGAEQTATSTAVPDRRVTASLPSLQDRATPIGVPISIEDSTGAPVDLPRVSERSFPCLVFAAIA